VAAGIDVAGVGDPAGALPVDADLGAGQAGYAQRAGQGLGAILAGAFAQWLGSAALVIGIGGLIGVAGTLLAALRGRAYGSAPASIGTTDSISVAAHQATSLPWDEERKVERHGSVAPRQVPGQPSPTAGEAG